MELLGLIKGNHHVPQKRVCDECLQPCDQSVSLGIVAVSMPQDEYDRPCYCLACLRAAVQMLEAVQPPITEETPYKEYIERMDY